MFYFLETGTKRKKQKSGENSDANRAVSQLKSLLLEDIQYHLCSFFLGETSLGLSHRDHPIKENVLYTFTPKWHVFDWMLLYRTVL